MNITVLANPRVEEIEGKMDEYSTLARELNKILTIKVTVVPVGTIKEIIQKRQKEVKTRGRKRLS